jgi:hypothetical protein|tara:strand:+ start:934 stop:1137 length:204 start_codon:yes stop_codon:yes gene_type:complete
MAIAAPVRQQTPSRERRMICRKCGGILPSNHDDPDPIHSDCYQAEVDYLKYEEQFKQGAADVDDGSV